MTISRSVLGWCAIVAGVVGLIGFVFLLLFFALEAPTLHKQGEADRRPRFGTLNDSSFVFVAILMIPVALGLHLLTKSRAPTLSLLGTAIGVAGFSAMAAVQAVYVLRSITTAQQAAAINIAFGAIGLWLVAISYLGRGLPHLSAVAAWLGILTGIAMVLLPLIYFAAGGSAILESPEALLKNVPFLIFFGLSTLALGIGFPIWAIVLGRRVLAMPGLGEVPPSIAALILVMVVAAPG